MRNPLSIWRDGLFASRAGWVAVPLALAFGCTGNITSGSGELAADRGVPGPGQGPGTGNAGGTGSIGPSDCSAAPAAPLRRLTRWEYNNTVADLLGDTARPADKFVVEAEQFGFDNNAAGAVLNPVVVEQFEQAAGTLAVKATANLPSLLACDAAASGNDVCASAFIASFFKRAYRRPLAAGEQARLEAFYKQASADAGFERAIQLLLSAALQSPHFLYRLEFGMPSPGATGAVRLGPWEIASRLSYLLIGSMPDAELLAAAEQGLLATPEQLLAQATRLLDSERGSRVVRNFHRQWAGLAELGDLSRSDPAYTVETAQFLEQETETFVDEVVRHGDGLLTTLLTAPYSYMNQQLAGFYGITGPTSATFVKVGLDPQRYAGLLTQGGLMARLAHAGQTSPVLRGKFIRENLFCSVLPPPPADVDATLPAPDPNATARDQLTQKTAVSPCSSCHDLLNPLGFAFEHFDALGRYRAQESGLPIDATGTLSGTDVDGPFSGQIEFAAMLGKSEQVRSCMVLNWFRYAYGRDQSDKDSCSMKQLNQAFGASGGNVKQLLLSLTQTSAFMYRDAVGTGAQP